MAKCIVLLYCSTVSYLRAVFFCIYHVGVGKYWSVFVLWQIIFKMFKKIVTVVCWARFSNCLDWFYMWAILKLFTATAWYKPLPQIVLKRRITGEAARRLQSCFSPGVIEIHVENGRKRELYWKLHYILAHESHTSVDPTTKCNSKLGSVYHVTLCVSPTQRFTWVPYCINFKHLYTIHASYTLISHVLYG